MTILNEIEEALNSAFEKGLDPVCIYLSTEDFASLKRENNVSFQTQFGKLPICPHPRDLGMTNRIVISVRTNGASAGEPAIVRARVEGAREALERAADYLRDVVTHPRRMEGVRYAEKVLRAEVDDILAPAPDEGAEKRRGGLAVEVRDGELTLSVGVEVLAEGAVVMTPGVRVVDVNAFAAEIARVLTNDGSETDTFANRIFESAAVRVIESGHDSIALCDDEDAAPDEVVDSQVKKLTDVDGKYR